MEKSAQKPAARSGRGSSSRIGINRGKPASAALACEGGTSSGCHRLGMGRPGDCFDNAPIESFFSTLKSEFAHHRRFVTRQQAGDEIRDYIERFYNRIRMHSTIGYRSPCEYERMAVLS